MKVKETGSLIAIYAGLTMCCPMEGKGVRSHRVQPEAGQGQLEESGALEIGVVPACRSML